LSARACLGGLVEGGYSRGLGGGLVEGQGRVVDVYLTKTLDYRTILFAVGANVPGAERVIRCRPDHDPDVALVTETLIAELVAAKFWVYAPKN
jgi:hypothetical protein